VFDLNLYVRTLCLFNVACFVDLTPIVENLSDIERVILLYEVSCMSIFLLNNLYLLCFCEPQLTSASRKPTS